MPAAIIMVPWRLVRPMAASANQGHLSLESQKIFTAAPDVGLLSFGDELKQYMFVPK